MADYVSSSDVEKEAKKLKRDLEAWREVILLCNSVLTWQKQTYPIILGSAISFLFLLLWYLDPSLVTGLSICGLIITLIDYLVPTIASQFCNSEAWTGTKEKQLEVICRGIAANKIIAVSRIRTFYSWRFDRPKLFYIITLTTLLFLSWIGNTINNLFLTYLIVLMTVMSPGLKSNDMFKKYTSILGGAVTSVSSTFISDPDSKKKLN